jgi:hypothetical protein
LPHPSPTKDDSDTSRSSYSPSPTRCSRCYHVRCRGPQAHSAKRLVYMPRSFRYNHIWFAPSSCESAPRRDPQTESSRRCTRSRSLDGCSEKTASTVVELGARNATPTALTRLKPGKGLLHDKTVDGSVAYLHTDICSLSWPSSRLTACIPTHHLTPIPTCHDETPETTYI